MTREPSHQAPLLAGVPLGWRMADAYLAIALLVFLELIVVGIAAFREFAAPYELGRAIWSLMPIALALAAPAAIAGGTLVELVRHGDRRGPRAAVALLSAGAAAAVAFGVSTGRLLAGGRRVPFVLIVAVTAGLGAFALAPVVARAVARRPGIGWRLWIAGFVIPLVIALEIANVKVLPRLYPAFHLGLTAITLLSAPFVCLALPWCLPLAEVSGPARQGRLLRALCALVLFALGAAASPSASRKLARSDNIRLIYIDHAPILARVVEIGALLSPPEPLGEGEALEERTSGHAIDLRGRDIVLITIDALRADHVGALGYSRKTTPNIDRLAQEGVLFEAAYTPTPHTSYAVTSIMTGKYMRPLVLQGLGADSETWASHLRRYGYQTAAFYPPAVFFIDAERLAPFRDRGLDFEYRKIQFASAAERVSQVQAYLDRLGSPAPAGGEAGSAGAGRVFLWVHLFEPHEPYEAHPEHRFGDRDVDRYDAEIAVADASVGAIVDAVRKVRPGAVIIVTADHGEEFLEHGGRYHGTTVYEEQVRVPLVVSAPGLLETRRVAAPVQLIDLLPTVLAGLDIPRPARVRGADLGALLTGADTGTGNPEAHGPADGFAFAETDTQTLLARGSLRLVCARKVGACALYDTAKDPGQTTDVASLRGADFADMRTQNRAIEASHGRYEVRGLHREGKGWPEALRRGLTGDADAANDVAALLDDADVAIRRKAGEVLFDLKRPETTAALRLALLRDEDEEARRWSALALTRLGEGAPLTRELLDDRDVRWRRLAALALAEAGDDRGEDVLIAWWRAAYGKRGPGAARGERVSIPFERAREIADALAKIRSKDAVPALLEALDDVRLRPYLAASLAAIGSDAARPALAEQLAVERYQTARIALAEALVRLGAGPELRAPLVRFLGTPDPLPNGLRIALDADVLELVGGPRDSALAKLRKFARSGVAVGMVVPKPAGTPSVEGLRVLCRARSLDRRPGEVRVGVRSRRGFLPDADAQDSLVPADAPELDAARATVLPVTPTDEPTEVFATLPASIGVRPGQQGEFVVYATQNVEVIACAVVPLADELPPPPPEPWKPEEDGESGPIP